jgi:hypothetical protein
MQTKLQAEFVKSQRAEKGAVPRKALTLPQKRSPRTQGDGLPKSPSRLKGTIQWATMWMMPLGRWQTLLWLQQRQPALRLVATTVPNGLGAAIRSAVLVLE